MHRPVSRSLQIRVYGGPNMPRFIVDLHRHTVRIRSATIKVKAPSEDAIRELDWTHDSFNDIVEWEEI